LFKIFRVFPAPRPKSPSPAAPKWLHHWLGARRAAAKVNYSRSLAFFAPRLRHWPPRSRAGQRVFSSFRHIGAGGPSGARGKAVLSGPPAPPAPKGEGGAFGGGESLSFFPRGAPPAFGKKAPPFSQKGLRALAPGPPRARAQRAPSARSARIFAPASGRHNFLSAVWRFAAKAACSPRGGPAPFAAYYDGWAMAPRGWFWAAKSADSFQTRAFYMLKPHFSN
jgi:hypothetical protein